VESAEDRSGQVPVDDRRRRVTPDASRIWCPTSTAPSSSGPAAAPGSRRARCPGDTAGDRLGSGTRQRTPRSSRRRPRPPPRSSRPARRRCRYIGRPSTRNRLAATGRHFPTFFPTAAVLPARYLRPTSIQLEGATNLVNTTDRSSPRSPSAWFRRPPAKSAVWFPAGRHRQTSPVVPGAGRYQ